MGGPITARHRQGYKSPVKKSENRQRSNSMTSIATCSNVIDLTTSYVLSMDIGPKNCAWIVVNTETKKVIVWEKFAYTAPYSSSNIAKQSVCFFDRLMRALHPIGASENNVDVVIEHQMTYSKRFSAINGMIQTAFHTIMVERGFRCWEMYPVTVKAMFQLGSRREKKKSSIKKAQELIDTGAVVLTVEQKNVFVATVKKDDLADCLLQAVCHIRRNN
jgi:hypothetical protein